ncbi:MAG: hypothetical protein ACFCU9_06970 [Cyanophyceae cyanobacterium]
MEIRIFRDPKKRFNIELPDEHENLKLFLEEEVQGIPYSCRDILNLIDSVVSETEEVGVWGGDSHLVSIYPETTIIEVFFSSRNPENPILEEISTEEFRQVIAECLEFGIQQGWDRTEEQIRADWDAYQLSKSLRTQNDSST